MSKVFEDYFSELQADMVSICLEYAHNKADNIFIYGSFEEGVISSDFFYRINGKVVERHKLNDALASGSQAGFSYDTAAARQRGTVRIINQNIEKLISLCKEYSREMPTEIKLVYDVNANKLTADYRYDLVYANDPVKTADTIAMEWFGQLQAKFGS